jgi:hypothetical protein
MTKYVPFCNQIASEGALSDSEFGRPAGLSNAVYALNPLHCGAPLPALGALIHEERWPSGVLRLAIYSGHSGITSMSEVMETGSALARHSAANTPEAAAVLSILARFCERGG